MNFWDILITAVIVAAVVLALRSIIKSRGRCSCGCAGCKKDCPNRDSSR